MTNSFLNEKIYLGVLWFLAIIGSQFYIFDSGGLQPGYAPLLIVMSLSFFRIKKIKSSDIHIIKYLVIFLLYIVIINLIWSIIEQDTIFLRSLIFWVFGFIVLISGVVDLNNSKTVSLIRYSAFSSILLLSIFWVLGVGRYNFFPRYNGYFNDPNQMALWTLCVFSIYFYLSPRTSKWLVSFLLMLSVVIVFATISRSALLGLIFSAIGVAIRFQGFGSKSSISNRVFYIVISIIVFLPALLYLSKSDIYIILLDRLLTSDFGSQAEIRGYTRILQYPEYLFIGAGQGLDTRFNSVNEIHSNWAALLFYYGIFGLSVFLVFLIKIIRKLDIAGKFIFIGPLIYGFSTYGLRTPVFWIFIATAIYAAKENTVFNRK
ncbi:hypothetical protein ACTXNA_11185 [Psychrobacter celer]|uniref:hypothetical protein n=1 Tax=Psychrobacter celer TaxID=306572 RepID=UPI003FCF37F3